MNRLFLMGFIILHTCIIYAGTRFYRASFRDDPATTIVIGWCDQGTSTNQRLYYGTQDHGQNYQLYPFQATVSRTVTHRGLTNRFVRLTNLQPGTTYYFVIKDDQSISPRMSFRTLSDNPNVPILFISGGDTRTGVPLFEFETSECIPRRRRGFELVAKIRPDFVAFNGDFVLTASSTTQWEDWFADWQLSIGPEGRLIPIVPVFGNHEDSQDIYNFFDVPNQNAYYALNFGGNLLRLYTLNTDMGCNTTQLNWFQTDLQLHSNNPTEPYWKAVQYHIPLVPHGEYSPMTSLISCWAPLFTQYKIKLSMEGHTHVVKVTWPIVPSNATGSDNGFIRDDINGTVYIGEGCWGAPLRNLYTYYSPNAAFNWTRNQGKFASFFVVLVRKQKIEIRTVRFNDAADVANVGQVQPNDPPGTLPAGLTFWNPSNGSVVEILSDKTFSDNANLASLSVSNGTLNPSFHPNTTTYIVELPETTTVIPTVSATAEHPGAYVTIHQATSLTGTQLERTAVVFVTAEDGVTTKTYTVTFNLVPIANADLASLNTSHGTLVPPFHPAILNYTVTLPYGTTDIPYVTATPADPNATVQITQPTAPDGIAIIVVTSANQQLTKTYTVDYSIASSTDNFITYFYVPNQIGNSIIDQVNNKITFTMPYGYNVSALVPQIIHTGVSIQPPPGQPQNFSQPVFYTVFSADNTPRTYEVTCEFAQASDDAYLIHLEVVGYTITPNFDPENTLYFIDMIPSEIKIIAIPRDPAATVKIFPPENLSGNAAQRTAQILVIAPNMTTMRLYSIVFGSFTGEHHASWINGIRVYPNPTTDFLHISELCENEQVQIYVYSGLGHLIYSATLEGTNNHTINTSQWISGTYYVIVKDKNCVVKRSRVIIQK